VAVIKTKEQLFSKWNDGDEAMEVIEKENKGLKKPIDELGD
tara:strand:- start:2426 stop:2548 length:123 start_codon:yes stop_codon:yes gene_type:complete